MPNRLVNDDEGPDFVEHEPSIYTLKDEDCVVVDEEEASVVTSGALDEEVDDHDEYAPEHGSSNADYEEIEEEEDDGQESGTVSIVPQSEGGNYVSAMLAHRESIYSVALCRAPFAQASAASCEHEALPALLAVTGSGDNTALEWYPGSQSEPQVRVAKEDSVCAVAFSYDNTWAAAGSMDGCIVIWGLPGSSGEGARHELMAPADVQWIDWHPSAHYLSIGCSDDVVVMYSISARRAQCVATFSGGHSGETSTCGVFLPNGKALLSAGEDGSVAMWSPKTPEMPSRTWRALANQLWLAPNESVSALAVCPATSTVAIAGGVYGNAVFFSPTTGRSFACFDLSTSQKPQKSSRVNSTQNGVEDEDEDEDEEIDESTRSIEKICFTPSGAPRLAAIASLSGVVAIANSEAARLRTRLVHDAGVTNISFLKTPEKGHLLVSATTSGQVTLWNALTGAQLQRFVGHQTAVLCMAIDPLDEYMITGDDDHAALVFRLPLHAQQH